MTASSAKSRSEILALLSDAPQLHLSNILPRIQSIKVLKIVGAVYTPSFHLLLLLLLLLRMAA